MKKTYISSIGVAFSALLLLALPASAQRGGPGSAASGGGNSAPAAAAPSPAPAPAPTRVEVAPPRQQPTYTAPRGSSNPPQQTYTAPRGSSNPPQQTYTAPRGNNNVGGSQPQQNSQPRGGYNQSPTVATSRGYNDGGQPRGGNIPQRGNNYNGFGDHRGNNGNFARSRGDYGQRNGYNPRRIGVAPNRTYRTYPGLAYGRNQITVRPGGIYYRNRGYYGSYYAPRLGVSLNVLPFGYYPFYYGPSMYFYSDGLFYQRDNDNYTVVEPPIGAEIKSLPDNAQSIMINGVQYYESNGVYYQAVTKDDGTVTYQVAGKDGELNTDEATAQDAPPLQVGDLVDALPDNYRKIKLNGQKYYVSEEGYYLQDAVDSDGNKVYQIVGTPDDGVDDNK